MPLLRSPSRGPPQCTCNNRTARPSVQVQPARQPALNSCGRKAACRSRLGGGPRPPAAALRLVPSMWSAERPAWPGRGPRENQAAPTPGGHTRLLQAKPQAVPGTQGPRWDREDRGHWASGASHSSGWGSLPPGVGVVSRGPGDTRATHPATFIFSLWLSVWHRALSASGSHLGQTSPPQGAFPDQPGLMTMQLLTPWAREPAGRAPPQTPASASWGFPHATPTPPLCLFSLPAAGQSLCSPPFPLLFPRLQVQISEDNPTLLLEGTQSSRDP